jgi:hypothetical protein
VPLTRSIPDRAHTRHTPTRRLSPWIVRLNFASNCLFRLQQLSGGRLRLRLVLTRCHLGASHDCFSQGDRPVGFGHFPAPRLYPTASSTEGNRYRTTGIHRRPSVITSYADENAILEVPMTMSTTTFCRPCWIDCQLYILRRRPEHLSIPDADNDWTFIVQLKADRGIKIC